MYCWLYRCIDHVVTRLLAFEFGNFKVWLKKCDPLPPFIFYCLQCNLIMSGSLTKGVLLGDFWYGLSCAYSSFFMPNLSRILQKYTTFGEFNTYPLTFFNSPSNIGYSISSYYLGGFGFIGFFTFNCLLLSWRHWL